ncbi:MAG: SRPBCC domain-containing protein [Gemmatimonadota bacterium]|nr:SRPBCC domain-containing protein [Gemmatimonadota bacterium]
MSTETSTSLQITRMLKAERARVFRAWSTADGLKQWACPEGATIEDVRVDLQVGGRYRIRMNGSEGQTYTAVGTYREITAPSRLVYSWEWEEPEHAVGETLVTVDFEAVGDSTQVTLSHERFPSPEAAGAHEQGWGSCLNRLDAALA